MIIKKETPSMRKIDNVSKMRIQDKEGNNPKEKADAFNKYNSCRKNINRQLERKEAVKLLHVSKKGDILEMKSIPTTETEIQHVIESLKLKNSAAYEGISSRILKYCTHAIT